jgi:hypothetical protein
VHRTHVEAVFHRREGQLQDWTSPGQLGTPAAVDVRDCPLVVTKHDDAQARVPWRLCDDHLDHANQLFEGDV